MKIKFPDALITIDILTIILVLAITFIPESAIRIVLGLPFLLYFPGYMLLAALFPSSGSAQEKGNVTKPGMDALEKTILSFGLSIVLTALIGLVLNYTPWGLKVQPVMYTMTGLIILLSLIAWIRRKQRKPSAEIRLRLPGWEGGVLNKALTVLLIGAIAAVIGVLGYTATNPRAGETYTEFYILGNKGMAENYPTQFFLKDGRISGVSYDGGKTQIAAETGNVSLGIVNHEQKKVTYNVVMRIGGQQSDIAFEGSMLPQLNGIGLLQSEKWEKEIGLSPNRTGDNQEIEFLLYREGDTSPYNSLHLMVSVK